jgi:hypothetical protein
MAPGTTGNASVQEALACHSGNIEELHYIKNISGKAAVAFRELRRLQELDRNTPETIRQNRELKKSFKLERFVVFHDFISDADQ